MYNQKFLNELGLPQMGGIETEAQYLARLTQEQRETLQQAEEALWDTAMDEFKEDFAAMVKQDKQVKRQGGLYRIRYI